MPPGKNLFDVTAKNNCEPSKYIKPEYIVGKANKKSTWNPWA
jgi:hypothetical protein